GLPPVGSDEPQRVALTGSRRGGLLRQAGVLAVTSHPDRTSPVLRGSFVLGQLLCRQPPPPPDDVPDLEVPAIPDAPLRVQLERHRSDPTCASCHAVMDPLGFALENYDVVGAWRDQDRGGFAIDATGQLPDGTLFTGGAELAAVLKQDPGLPSCMTRQLLVYALGRGLNVPTDRCHVNELVEGWAERGYRLRELVVSITTSRAFTHRRGEAGE
ncbi:MAG: DUF1588 domain-containing protein, partial [Myxococcales bacterium]